VFYASKSGFRKSAPNLHPVAPDDHPRLDGGGMFGRIVRRVESQKRFASGLWERQFLKSL
jgi:hypothetical protein